MNYEKTNAEVRGINRVNSLHTINQWLALLSNIEQRAEELKEESFAK